MQHACHMPINQFRVGALLIKMAKTSTDLCIRWSSILLKSSIFWNFACWYFKLWCKCSFKADLENWKKKYLHTANYISTSIGQSSQKSMYVKLFFSYPIKSIYLYSDVKQ